MVKIPGRKGTGHGGNIHAAMKEGGLNYDDLIDFSANINPLGPPEWLRAVVSRELGKTLHYPDPEYTELTAALAEQWGVAADQIVIANGSTELLYALPNILSCSRAVIPVPSYIDYSRAVRLSDLEILPIQLREEDSFQLDITELSRKLQDNDLVIIGTPNNPTGNIVNREAIVKLASDFPKVIFVLDEAFLDFVDGEESAAGIRPNLLTLNSMTKFYGIPGLRLGFGVFPSDIARKLKDYLPPWTVNSIAYSFGIQAIEDASYCKKTKENTERLRADLVEGLQRFSQLKVYRPNANYIFLKILSDTSAPILAQKMLEKGILIRCCDNYDGLDEQYFRVAVRTAHENIRLLAALDQIFNPRKKAISIEKPTPAIMFQGTSSNAGKSVLTAALCRILLQDGLNIAPFKAQNMSLNSFVTLKGEEMGRAQVVQAQAAKLDPDVRMNPILLKPNSDTGSQVILRGKPVGNMSVLTYSKYKEQAWGTVTECYDSLADEYDAIILEGAGSPGEVNLKNEDIVNMRMAEYAGAPVLLVGDIDRGGVYASFVGTCEVLSEWERNLIGGFVVNRFRGDQSLLASAHDYVRGHTGKPVLGVVPFLADLGLPEEDSVSFKAGLFNREAEHEEWVDIVLINLPHISNFTDVEPLLGEPDVRLRVVENVDDLGSPDAIILPGSKNVIGDLQFLLDKEFRGIFEKHAEDGCEIVGICGGYQMLGRSIRDPLGIESSGSELSGLGLLDINTDLKAEKRLVRQVGIHLESGHEVFGYEIHHGISDSPVANSLQFHDGTFCGSTSERLHIWGTYLHGIFDSDPFRRWFVDRLRERKGLPPVGKVLAPYDLEGAFDRVADVVRQNIDMDTVYKFMKL